MIKKILKISFVFIILFSIVFTTIYSINLNESKIFRLHVRANSNKNKDQEIKEKIAIKIDSYIDYITKDIEDIDEIYNIIIDNTDNITKIANNILKENNFDYTSNIYIGNIYFDEEKEKNNIKQDKGFYNSIIVTLGSGTGNNFWDLIFPKEKDVKNLKNLENVFPYISEIYETNKEIDIYEVNIYNENINENSIFNYIFKLFE